MSIDSIKHDQVESGYRGSVTSKMPGKTVKAATAKKSSSVVSLHEQTTTLQARKARKSTTSSKAANKRTYKISSKTFNAVNAKKSDLSSFSRTRDANLRTRTAKTPPKTKQKKSDISSKREQEKTKPRKNTTNEKIQETSKITYIGRSVAAFGLAISSFLKSIMRATFKLLKWTFGGVVKLTKSICTLLLKSCRWIYEHRKLIALSLKSLLSTLVSSGCVSKTIREKANLICEVATMVGGL